MRTIAACTPELLESDSSRPAVPDRDDLSAGSNRPRFGHRSLKGRPGVRLSTGAGSAAPGSRESGPPDRHRPAREDLAGACRCRRIAATSQFSVFSFQFFSCQLFTFVELPGLRIRAAEPSSDRAARSSTSRGQGWRKTREARVPGSR